MAYVNFGVTFLDTSPITIGDMCFIAPGVILTCAGHPVVAEQRNKGIETSKPITIGNSVWIGAHATICGGVKIGDHAESRIKTSSRQTKYCFSIPKGRPLTVKEKICIIRVIMEWLRKNNR